MKNTLTILTLLVGASFLVSAEARATCTMGSSAQINSCLGACITLNNIGWTTSYGIPVPDYKKSSTKIASCMATNSKCNMCSAGCALDPTVVNSCVSACFTTSTVVLSTSTGIDIAKTTTKVASCMGTNKKCNMCK